MAHIQVYDPPLCCASGVCGPVVDEALPRFAADAAWLREQGVRVVRYNLATNPAAFARADAVWKALEERGPAALPMVVVDGRVVSEGAYPTRDALAAVAGLSDSERRAS